MKPVRMNVRRTLEIGRNRQKHAQSRSKGCCQSSYVSTDQDLSQLRLIHSMGLLRVEFHYRIRMLYSNFAQYLNSWCMRQLKKI